MKEDLLTSGRKNFELSDKLRAEKKLRCSIKADILAATRKLDEALSPDVLEENPDDHNNSGQADTNKKKNMGEKHPNDAGEAEAASRRTRSKKKETKAEEQSAKKTQNTKITATNSDTEVAPKEKRKRAVVASSMGPYVKLYRLSNKPERQ